ncbi:hypothetical protein [Streptomyces sp. NPDC048248]|uniref:hypothetical protein n=1 Tax=Streptomyces sp. NPDC048248 TaxID=3365523 RepID=UPI00371DDEF0
MRTPTGIEQRLLQAQMELLDCPEFTVERSTTGDLGEKFSEAPALFSYLPDWQGVQLSDRLCVGSPRISELANFWHHGQASDTAGLSGEFRVTDLFTALLKHPPDLAWQGSTEDEREFFTQWRVIDDTPLSALGQLAAIRIQPEVDPLEIWYYDMELTSVETRTRQYVPLDLTYTDYMEQLAITKGTLGWQYLFTQGITIGHPDFEDVRNQLTTMLQLFPRLFPDWDYTELTQRLEARL